MKNILYLLVLLGPSLSEAQTNTIDYIAYAEDAYYEIVKLEDDVSVMKYYLDASKIKQAILIFSSVKEIKSQLNIKTLVKAKRLAKNWNHNNQVSFNFKTDTIYAFQFRKGGSKELWHLQGVEGDVRTRFWCKSKEQPVFIPIKNKQFDVVLVTRNDKLSLVYYDKRKGVQGDVSF